MVNTDDEINFNPNPTLPEMKWAVKGNVPDILNIQNSHGLLPNYNEEAIEYAIHKMVTRIAVVGNNVHGVWIGGLESHGSGIEYRLAEMYVAQPALGTGVTRLMLNDVMQAAEAANIEVRRLAAVKNEKDFAQVREVTLRVPEYLCRPDFPESCIGWLQHVGFVATGVVDRDFYFHEGKPYDGYMFSMRLP